MNTHPYLRAYLGGIFLPTLVLPLVMAPIGALVATHLHVLEIGAHGVVWFQTCRVPYAWVAPGFLVAMAAYYLVWKYIVGFLNRVLGIA